MRNRHDHKLLRDAAFALRDAVTLLDRRFGSKDWRRDWTIAETAEEIHNEAWGYPSLADAEHEARTRGGRWHATLDERGAAVVREAEGAREEATAAVVAALRRGHYQARSRVNDLLTAPIGLYPDSYLEEARADLERIGAALRAWDGRDFAEGT